MTTPAEIDLSALPPEVRAAFEAERARRLALEADVAALAEHNRRLEHLVAEFRQVLYGKRSEKLGEDERQLAFEGERSARHGPNDDGERDGRRRAGAVVQALAPAHLIEGALPTERLIAHVLVSKYADHLPLYRQSQIFARAGIELGRSTLADWVGKAAFHLAPIVARMAGALKRSGKLFLDETTAPVLDPGRGRTKTGYLWALARDDR